MDALIYTIMSGADRALRAQQVRANNLANAGTTGFRADIELASSQPVPGYGYDARHFTVSGPAAVSMKGGVLAETGRALDAAIEGEGFFAVAGRDGEAYTRAGNFDVDAQGRLTQAGRPVLGEGGEIVLPPHVAVSIAADGEVSVQPAGETTMRPVGRLKLVRPAPDEMVKTQEGLLVSRLGQPLPADASVRVRDRHLEASNVSAVEEMVATLALNRSFDIQMKLYGAASDMVEAGNRLLRS